MTAAVPGKLAVGADGRVRGAAAIAYNTPWPCPNGSWGSGAMMGVLMHTMVGDLPGTIAVFNDPAYQASAHFGIAQDGTIWQFGPIGMGWEAWHAVAANRAWYGIEHADGGDTRDPLTPEQVTASAQLVECLSAFAGFPLQVTDSPGISGLGTHVMGGAAWGGHTCPGPGPRAAQRAQVIALAQQIRAGAQPDPPTEVPDMVIVTVNPDQIPKGTPWPGTFRLDSSGLHHITTPADLAAYQAAGLNAPVTISWTEYLSVSGKTAEAAAADPAPDYDPEDL